MSATQNRAESTLAGGPDKNPGSPSWKTKAALATGAAVPLGLLGFADAAVANPTGDYGSSLGQGNYSNDANDRNNTEAAQSTTADSDATSLDEVENNGFSVTSNESASFEGLDDMPAELNQPATNSGGSRYDVALDDGSAGVVFNGTNDNDEIRVAPLQGSDVAPEVDHGFRGYLNVIDVNGTNHFVKNNATLRINGHGGDDLIVGSDNGDIIVGGAGADTLDGHAGENIIFGLEGDDTILTGTDPSHFNAGPGTDKIMAKQSDGIALDTYDSAGNLVDDPAVQLDENWYFYETEDLLTIIPDVSADGSGSVDENPADTAAAMTSWKWSPFEGFSPIRWEPTSQGVRESDLAAEQQPEIEDAQTLDINGQTFRYLIQWEKGVEPEPIPVEGGIYEAEKGDPSFVKELEDGSLLNRTIDLSGETPQLSDTASVTRYEDDLSVMEIREMTGGVEDEGIPVARITRSTGFYEHVTLDPTGQILDGSRHDDSGPGEKIEFLGPGGIVTGTRIEFDDVVEEYDSDFNLQRRTTLIDSKTDSPTRWRTNTYHVVDGEGRQYEERRSFSVDQSNDITIERRDENGEWVEVE